MGEVSEQKLGLSQGEAAEGWWEDLESLNEGAGLEMGLQG